jgi:hypothetical protein
VISCQSQIENTWGERIRPVAGTDKVEISTTYFYESQEHTSRVVGRFTEFAATQGVTVICPPQNIRFAMKPWPKQSWATVTVEVKEQA